MRGRVTLFLSLYCELRREGMDEMLRIFPLVEYFTRYELGEDWRVWLSEERGAELDRAYRIKVGARALVTEEEEG